MLVLSNKSCLKGYKVSELNTCISTFAFSWLLFRGHFLTLCLNLGIFFTGITFILNNCHYAMIFLSIQPILVYMVQLGTQKRTITHLAIREQLSSWLMQSSKLHCGDRAAPLVWYSTAIWYLFSKVLPQSFPAKILDSRCLISSFRFYIYEHSVNPAMISFCVICSSDE